MRTALALGACALLTPAAAAEIVTVRSDFTSASLGFFGIQFSADTFAPFIDGTVVDARIHLEFNTEDPNGNFHDAADLLIQMQPPTQNVPVWDVLGSDLGWSGTGTFTADLSSDVFDGEQMLPPPFPDALMLYFYRIVSIDDQNQVLGGKLTNSYWEIDIETVPAPSTAAVAGLGLLPLVRRRRRS